MGRNAHSVEMLVISTQGDAGPAGPPGVPGSVVSGAAPALGTRDSQTVNSWGEIKEFLPLRIRQRLLTKEVGYEAFNNENGENQGKVRSCEHTMRMPFMEPREIDY